MTLNGVIMTKSWYHEIVIIVTVFKILIWIYDYIRNFDKKNHNYDNVKIMR